MPGNSFHGTGYVWKHLYSNLEGWGAPWDRVVFDYLIFDYGGLPPIIVAVILQTKKWWSGNDFGLKLIHAWAVGVVLPFTLATVKTPTATLIAMPASYLILARFVSDADRPSGGRWPRSWGWRPPA